MNIKYKSIFTAGAMASIIAPVITTVSCGSSSSSVSAIEEKNKQPDFIGTKVANHATLASVVSDPENPRWQKSRAYIQANGEAAGFQTTTNIIKASNDQKTWLDTQKSADVWVIGATDDGVAGTWTTRTQNQPVIAYDRLVKTPNRTAYNWYVTFDNSKVGRLQGISILAKLYNEPSIMEKTDDQIIAYATAHKLAAKTIIASMAGDPADNNAGLFFHGAMDILKKVTAVDSNLQIPSNFSDFSTVSNAGWNYAAGLSKLQTQLTGLQGDKSAVKAVLSPNDGMANSAIQALKNVGLNPKEVFITGQDSNDTALHSIKNNTGQDMTIYKSDAQATSVTVGLAKYLVAHPEVNIADASAKKDDILNAIKADFAFPSWVKMAYDHTSYNTAAGAPINTIILDPIVIDQANLSTFFIL